MSGIKKIPILPNMSGIYLFEFVETQKRGVFVPETDDLSVGDKVELLFCESKNRIMFTLTGAIDWINQTDDLGVGVVFDGISNEQFKLAITVLHNIAYI